MLVLIRIFRLMLLIISFYGYVQYFEKKININLVIGFIFSSIGSLMFLAGLLNVLQEVAVAIFIGGISLAVVSALHRESFRNVLSGGTVFFFIVGTFSLYILYGSKFLHYDNFSHWAKVCQILIQNDRFPNFSDSNFYFTSYPPGSAAFIYYLCYVSGISSEWFQMYAQTILMAGMLSSLFSFSKQPITAFLTGFFGIALLCGNQALVNLLVDTLLPVTALSGMCLCLFYRHNLDKKVAYLIPYTVFLLTIKNSGAIFALIIICVGLCHLNDKRNYKSLLLLILPPIISALLWNKHTKYVFVADKAGKHAMTYANYKSVFEAKELQDIIDIGINILRRTFSFNNNGLGVICVAIVIWMICRVVQKHETAIERELTMLVVVSYFAYQVGLLGMYIFSMPLYEAAVLAGYDRYHRTILIFISALVLVEALFCFENKDGKRSNIFLGIGYLVGTVLGLTLLISPYFSYLQKQNVQGSDRDHFDRLIQEYNLLPNKRYVILTGERPGDAGYLRYLTGYLLNPDSYSFVSDNDIENVSWEKYDYVIIFEESQKTREILAQYYSGTIVG